MNTPVLFIIFNRPETTSKVFEAIRQAKPKQLFVAADGPRSGRAIEKEKCMQARAIATQVDWDCEVKTLFRDENVGCGRGPAEAITWFFEHVEQGIILEDDCVPDSTFFTFCEELLNRYRNNKEVVIISGFNQLGTYNKIKEDYFFTQLSGIWGWASWRRAWDGFNYQVPEWNNVNLRNKVLQSLPTDRERADMQEHLDRVSSGVKVDYWDFQWWFYRILKGGVGILPKYNLIKNIGFGEDATHTFDINSPVNSIQVKPLRFPLKHPALIEMDKKFDSILIKYFSDLSKNGLLKRIRSKVKSWIS